MSEAWYWVQLHGSQIYWTCFFGAMVISLTWSVYKIPLPLSGRGQGEGAWLLSRLLLVCLSGLLTAKWSHILFESSGHILSNDQIATGIWDLLKDDPWHGFRLLDPGYVLYGGLLGGAFASYWLFRSNWLAVCDACVAPLALGIAIGRIGCFVAGCCHGEPTQSAMGVHYAYSHLIELGPIWPIPLVEAIFCVLLARFVTNLREFLLAYAIFRFVAEFFRGDTERGFWFYNALSTAQVVSLCILIAIITIRSWYKTPDPG